ncbi:MULTISPECIES: acyl carrier protein [Vallitalea]|jgi:acyl carrier protein|uniref:Acyl carrier protein n=2 Tax=Vallitalea TaxID=1348611 RepID=A0A8J8MB34_9FIRM|nr:MULTISPECIES: acyl carrier protein [Vallitalea]MCT4685746.1 acyl carrier protein [Vallitalea sp.]QUH29435.1 acyl carrier protein [Vallitalea guaymasensis]GMQ64893.1 acyl carrier protein [Vallitalea sp. AN17-2]
MDFEKLKEVVIDQLDVEESEVTLQAKFIDDLGADSLDLFELVMAIEEESGVEIKNEDLPSVITVQDALDYVKNNQ